MTRRHAEGLQPEQILIAMPEDLRRTMPGLSWQVDEQLLRWAMEAFCRLDRVRPAD